MTKQQRIRTIIDISMTILSLILMGGVYFFSWDGLHEILGVVLLVLWGVHIFLNYRWYKSVFKGKYNSYRILQTIINCGILICAILLMISGIMLSKYLFSFLGINFGFSFARISHLLFSHWYFMFMSLHIGLHASMITKRLGIKFSLLARIIIALICAYGIFAFISRGIWKYLILQQKFFFFDLEKGYFLFFIDYISIMVLFATLTSLLAKKLH